MFDFSKLKQKWIDQRFERKRRSEKARDILISKGKPIFKKYNIEKVLLFGSVASGESIDFSDIDILAFSLEKNNFWECRHELEEAIGYFVDLYTQDDDPEFVKKILLRGEIVYEVQL